ncbi:glucose-6-phosphate isomerase [Desulfothermus sp.]
MDYFFSKTLAYKNLCKHYTEIKDIPMRDMFLQDKDRFKKFSIKLGPILFDYSKNRITQKTIKLLLELADEASLKEKIHGMFTGEIINTTEKRRVMHWALRCPENEQIVIDGTDWSKEIHSVLKRIERFVGDVRSGTWKGFTGKRITDVVNLGIGGSDLGPKMVVRALDFLASDDLKVHFVSNVDPAHLNKTLKHLSPETTLFIISSKSFTTQETMENAKRARTWIVEKFGDDRCVERHFVAISTNKEGVINFGIDPKNMFEFWDFVGGRYSLWSAIGTSIALSIGFDNFKELLKGAHMVDNHFKNADFKENIPVIMGVLDVWYVNFFGAKSIAILPYSQCLEEFPNHLQQLIMESNGKRITTDGREVDFHTSPVVWGRVGTDGQHSFYQLLHQGTQIIPCDFIGFVKNPYNTEDQHDIFMANFFAQTRALMQGKDEKEVLDELKKNSKDAQKINNILPHKIFPGNRPSNSILIDELNPFTLGALIALYEHRVFVQGCIWNINSFDQWGVELGKRLAKDIIDKLNKDVMCEVYDSSTNGLINYYNKTKRGER